MPLPPLTRDYVTVGGTQSFSDTLWTWGQIRTPVYAAQHGTGSYSFWGNTSHAFDYIIGVYGIEAVESGDRLFRGQPFGAVGYNDYATFLPGPPPVNQYRFYFGHNYEDPLNPGIFIPIVGTGLDKDYESAILTGAVYVGSTSSVTVAAAAFDGSDPSGQDMGTTPLGIVSSVTLAF